MSVAVEPRVIVIFRNRLRPEQAGAGTEYAAEAAEIARLAAQQPGVVAFKTFTAADGERVTLAEFDSPESAAAWRAHPRHRDAQRAGRERFYSEYRVQVCEVSRAYAFVADAPTGEGTVP